MDLKNTDDVVRGTVVLHTVNRKHTVRHFSAF